jgi:hypothetical protein
MNQPFQLKNPNHSLSPYTGMGRNEYIELGTYILDRAFTYVKDFSDPMLFPWVEGKTYPQPDDPPWRTVSSMFEALERTFTIAGPLIHTNPEVEIRGIKLKDYYSYHLFRALTPGNPNSIPLPDTLPDATYQFTCEFGGLCKTLLLLPDLLWDGYSKEQQDQIAETISAWAHHRTTQNNWRIFNIMALSFLKLKGYSIDDQLLEDHLLWILSYHSGDGWYLEQTYNYYTISLFIVYGTIWSRTFGDTYYPEVAKAIDISAIKLFETYPSFFGKDGYINMWARSICYRTWVSGGFIVSFMLKDQSPLDPGFARRLCSGSLLQFVQHPEFFVNDVPSLGFYGHCEFAVQNYSCSASPFLMFLPFIALALPEDHSFWTAKENQGFWQVLGSDCQVSVLDKPGLVLVNHGKTGTSEIYPGKVYYRDPNYSKLIYSTHFPWEDQDPNGPTAMEYSFRSLDPRDLRGDDINFYLTGIKLENQTKEHQFTTSDSMLYNGVRDGVIYRQAVMRKPPNNGVGYILDLADYPLPGGVVRIDRSRLAFEHQLGLGHFGLPHINGQKALVTERKVALGRCLTASIPGRQVALITYSGWDTLEARVHSGKNSEAQESTVLYAQKTREQKNPAMELMITCMLHKMGDEPWTDDELNPVKAITIHKVTKNLAPLGAEIELATGKILTVDFHEIDGNKTC